MAASSGFATHLASAGLLSFPLGMEYVRYLHQKALHSLSPSVMAPVERRLVASWFTGWISIGGQIMLTASAAFAGGLQLQALITLNNLDTYV